MPLPLVTEHLRIRPFVMDDAPEIHRLISSDPDVQRYRHARVAATVEESLPFFEWLLEHQRTHGYSLWAVEDRITSELLGQCGIVRARGPIELAYSFGREHWGRGYGTEAARACLAYGLGELGLAPIVAMMDLANVGSKRVAEKCGMRFDGQAAYTRVTYLRYVAP
jgi:RimJ/RimL family protein N-acetyltransferase